MSQRAGSPQVAAARRARHRRNRLMQLLMTAGATLAILPLIAIIGDLAMRGARAMSISFLLRSPAPVGVSGGGMGNAIAGTMLLVLIGSLIGIPVGLGAGLFVAERAHTRLAQVVRYVADVLSGLPSIVVGVFVWELLVRPVGRFSALAGGVALGLLIIPMVTRATEEVVRLLPRSLIEAALALGFPRWRTALVVVLRTSMPGIVTAALVAIARAAGETAPLLFTALGNTYWSTNPFRPIAALPLQIFAYAQSPFDDLRAQAWAGALVLVVLVVVFSLIARAVLQARQALLRGGRPSPLTGDRESR